MINYITKGDIFRLPGVTSYAHGCNCMGAMGKGIAVQFRQRFPDMYRQYNQLCMTGQYVPGSVFAYEYQPGSFVYNLATQKHYAGHGQHAKPDYIRKSISFMLEHAASHGVTDIALPKIGAGLGGLDWNEVQTVIEELAAGRPDITFHIVLEYSPV